MEKLLEKALRFVENSEEETLNLIKDICVIPAPSGKEEKRAEFVKNYLVDNGAQGVYIDEALNVVYPVGVTNDNDIVLFLAHTDTVFPDLTEMPFNTDGKYMYSPGVGDNVTCLAQMLTVAKFIAKNNLTAKTGILIVANSCEEGLGNLKGVKEIINKYGKRIKVAYSFDGQYDALVTKCVGSDRYKIKVKTKGGHSFNAFGNVNAITVLADLIHEFYKVSVPVINGSKTTYNVGVITGGTSVNTIAEEAEILYEYRSDNDKCLEIMRQEFDKQIEKFSLLKGVELTVAKVGERPCGKCDNEFELNKIIENTRLITEKYSGIKCNLTSGSTDCNIPASIGIPAVCVGTHEGEGAHTREEKVLISSVIKGLKIVAETIIQYFI